MERIGFIGAGHIGSNMVLRLMDKGRKVRVCDINDAVRRRFADEGAETTGEARDLADCGTIVAMVADDRQLDAVLFGPGGLAEALAPQAAGSLIVMSTVLPATVRDLPGRLGRPAMAVVDAPVSGGPASARKGILSIMAGGTEVDFGRVRPVLELMGEKIFHCGELGAGAAAKLVNNILGICNVYLAAEAYAVAQALGTDLERMIPVIEAGTGRNFWSKSFAETVSQYAALTDPAAGFHSMIDIVTKDLKIINALPERAGLTLPMLAGVEAGVHGMHERAVAERVFGQWIGIARAGEAG